MEIEGGRDFSVLPTVNGDNVVIVTDSVGIFSDMDLTGISTDDYLQWDGAKFVPVSAPTSVFGSEYQYAESLAESSTTLGTFQQKLRLTTPVIPAGDYRIEWYFEYWTSSAAERGEWQVELDDATVLTTFTEEPDSSANRFAISGWSKETLTNAAHTIDIDYRDAEAGTAYIRQAKLAIWRIS